MQIGDYMTDIEIAHSIKMQEIKDIAKKINVDKNIECYGKYKAKIDFEQVKTGKRGKLVLVTATSPTPYGEGKTTVSIGLVDALSCLSYKSLGLLREPSLGPVFGIKGGATGGGYSQIVPMEEINLHFTGDFHAITAANNLLCAAIDNHIHQGNVLNIDKERIMFNRCLDVNDRILKNVIIDSGRFSRNEVFTITAASEIMAILCLASDLEDLRWRLEAILVAMDLNGRPLFAKDLNVVGSLMVLLKDAIKPNLVQTLEHNPVIVHGGPFANIAHGCSSLIATKLGLELADYCVTEAGFGSDLGALKYYDIKCRLGDVKPDVTVLVTTIKALKYNGNGDLVGGLRNLEAHLDILGKMTKNIVVCLNKFYDDLEEDIEELENFVVARNYRFAISDAYLNGGKGAVNLAKEVVSFESDEEYHELYDINDSFLHKLNVILKDIYHAGVVNISGKAKLKIEEIEAMGLDKLPICVAKTQYSISDNKDLLGNPTNYEVEVRDIKLYNGAGFVTVYLGNIIAMPGLPVEPNYEKIDLVDGEIVGLF